MRKVILLLLPFLSVLLVWGQNEKSFDLESAKKLIYELKELQPTVIEKANMALDSKIPPADKAMADSILTQTFASLYKVINIYQALQENKELELQAQKVIEDFLKDNRKAIFSDDQSCIQITTRSFLNVAENKAPQFEEIYRKAQEYISQQVTEPNEDALVIEDGKKSHPVPKNNSAIFILDLIALGLGIIGVILGGYAIKYVNSAHNRITTTRKEIAGLDARLTQRINEIKPSSYRGPVSSAHVPQHQYKPKPQVPRKDPVAVQQTRKEEPKPHEPIVEQRPTLSNLFATVKADSPLAEFFKVTPENSGDKVFMLTLSYPEAQVADFTIVPNMTPDFMKSVIDNKDIYLPATFCEKKSIDSQNPSRIEVLSQGRAKKVDGKWQVQERMSIRLV